MADPFVAEIRIFGGNFAPKGWATCDGQIMPISQNTALFALLGTFYGGDGKVTFALPNLQGSSPMHQGNGQGLSPRFLGEAAGEPYVTLISSEMPTHNHVLSGVAGRTVSDAPDPTGSWWGSPSGDKLYDTATNNPMAADAYAFFGGSQPHNNMPPYLTLTFIIALQGIFPPRT